LITDEQREFIDRLDASGLFDPVYKWVVEYAARRLPRWSGVRDPDAPYEVADEAMFRLYSNGYVAWNPGELSAEELGSYLIDRVDDIVSSRSRARRRDRCVGPFDSRRHDGAEDTVESTLYTREMEDAWLSRAADRDERVGEVVLEWIGDNVSIAGQTAALGIDRSTAYRLRTSAREIFSELKSEQETRE
jgi:hypothetical protein